MVQGTVHESATTWNLRGFDVFKSSPGVIVIKPNRSRSTGSFLAMAIGVLFFGTIALLFNSVWIVICLRSIGLLQQPPNSANSGTANAVIALFAGLIGLGSGSLAIFCLYILVVDEMIHIRTPITLDKTNDSVLFGRRRLCAMSDIDSLALKCVIPNQTRRDGLCRYEAYIVLRSGRRIPYGWTRGTNPLRYSLGLQHDDVQRVAGEAAQFIGAKLYYRTEVEPPPSRGM